MANRISRRKNEKNLIGRIAGNEQWTSMTRHLEHEIKRITSFAMFFAVTIKRERVTWPESVCDDAKDGNSHRKFYHVPVVAHKILKMRVRMRELTPTDCVSHLQLLPCNGQHLTFYQRAAQGEKSVWFSLCWCCDSEFMASSFLLHPFIAVSCNAHVSHIFAFAHFISPNFDKQMVHESTSRRRNRLWPSPK